MDISSGMFGGILTDYLSPDIAKNVRERAEGTRKQVEILSKVRTEEDMLRFFGIAA